ncbi:NAD(P)-binding protein [Zopfia rhizophila CBS 207.26]|uniref:NAD(P)-binding protein n=1 Tax=Zopfia rhizophila CBS 207.26 TaxID=1314779 RepID=A0A6A6EFE9_9PEZI|nr:NAD(P)-binding protein [Zopfia rhizophila CBS 207.26]
MSKTLLITGATGKQGGAVIKALAGSGFEILALTRNPSSPSAQKLSQRSSNVKLLQGDLDNPTAIFHNSQEVTSNPIWGVFSVQVNVVGSGGKTEEQQGKALIDAALAANVKFFIYTSVDRGGPRSSSNPTPVPHFAAKHNIEKHLEQKAANSSMQFTVLRPTSFMDGLVNDFQGQVMVSMWKTAMRDKPMQLIATCDIGWFAAQAFKCPNEFAGRYLSLAGAELTFDQANEIFKRRFGRDMPSTYGILASILLWIVKEAGETFKWLSEDGYGADIEELKRMYPDLMDFRIWLEKESNFKAG